MNIVYHHGIQAQKAEGVHIREIVRAIVILGNKVIVVSPPGINIYDDNPASKKESNSLLFTAVWKAVGGGLQEVVFEFFDVANNLFVYTSLSKFFKEKK